MAKRARASERTSERTRARTANPSGYIQDVPKRSLCIAYRSFLLGTAVDVYVEGTIFQPAGEKCKIRFFVVSLTSTSSIASFDLALRPALRSVLGLQFFLQVQTPHRYTSRRPP